MNPEFGIGYVCVILVDLEIWEKLRILDLYESEIFNVCVANSGC